MTSKIGPNHGAEASRQRFNTLDPGKNAHNVMYGEPGKKYPEAPSVAVEGTLRKLIEGHNDYLEFKQVMQNRPF